MPNYCYNTIAVKGKKCDVIKFINDGLNESGKHISEITDKTLPIIGKAELTMRSWLPMPQTFIDYDTTNKLLPLDKLIYFDTNGILGKNFPNDLEVLRRARNIDEIPTELLLRLQEFYDDYKNKWEKAKVEQQEKYGVVGWYEYNIKTLGTKRNTVLYDFDILINNNNEILITFKTDTAWSMPMEWLQTLNEKYKDLTFVAFASEESNEFCGYIDMNSGTWVEEISTSLKLGNYDDDNWDEQVERVNNLIDECYVRFNDYIFDV